MACSPHGVAAARAANAAFFFAVAAYAFLAYSPFAYSQFIQPSVVPALTDFVRLSPQLFWLALLITVTTLLPLWRGGVKRPLVAGYILFSIAAGAAVTAWRPLTVVGNTSWALGLGLAALLPPVWLAAIDLATWPAARVGRADTGRLARVCAMSAVAAWAVYAVAVPIRMQRVSGIDLTGAGAAASMAAALVADCFVFGAVFLAIVAARAIAERFDLGASGEQWLLTAILAAAAAWLLYFLVCAALVFVGPAAMAASAALGSAFAIVWAGIARVRAWRPVDALAVFGAPIVGAGARPIVLFVLALLPLAAYVAVDAVAQLDWNFLLQKLSVLAVWLVTFAAVQALVPARRVPSRSSLWNYMAAVVIIAFTGLVRIEGRVLRDTDQYAALDPSFRLLRDARVAPSAETAEYYSYLRRHTLVRTTDVRPVLAQFVPSAMPPAARRPNIFVLVVDSLRRDYLSPYNAAVTFTPAISRLAADSYTFERAFTRYAGTYLAVMSTWAGGMVIHATDQPDFDRRNALQKLLTANSYRQVMNVDSVVREFLPPTADVTELERGAGTMQVSVCSSLTALRGELARSDRSRPIFYWALPQDVHIGVLTHTKVPAGESYPGFFDKTAHQLRLADRCIGEFVDFLKHDGLYDDSIIVLTADHGDVYGFEGRWGHANLLYPDVMRVPLIVHLPSWLRPRVKADVGQVAFLTDLAPTLYALLGYQPAELGPLFGRPLFADGAAAAAPRDGDFLVASAYGAVYGVVSRNGRELYVVDTMEGRDYAADMSGPVPAFLELTRAATVANRGEIQHQIDLLAALYGFQP